MEYIRIRHLDFYYDSSREILSDLCLSVEKKENIGLIGANGAGKSTFLKLLVGLLEDYRGEILMGGLSMKKKNIAKIRQMTGYVFADSDSQLFLSTVYEDIAFGPRNYGLDRNEVEQRVDRALQQVHLEKLRNRAIYQLSGGEKKLVSIATILSMEPEILLLDEPSNTLDPQNRRNLIHILNELSGIKLIASHDLDLILDTCSRTILLSEGRIIKDGKTREILTDEALLQRNGLELPLSLSRR